MGDSPLKLLDRQIKDTLTTKAREWEQSRRQIEEEEKRIKQMARRQSEEEYAKLFINDGTAGTAIDGLNASVTKVVNVK